MRCLDRLGANVLIQPDANDGQWTGADGSDAKEQWQPLSWMGSAWRAVTDPSVRFTYAVNPMMVGNLSDTPFDGQSAILQRGRRGNGCHYVGNRTFVPGDDDPALRELRGRQAAVPRARAVGGARWTAAEAPQRSARRSPPAPVRTATSRPRSSPTCRSRPTATGADAWWPGR